MEQITTPEKGGRTEVVVKVAAPEACAQPDPKKVAAEVLRLLAQEVWR